LNLTKVKYSSSLRSILVVPSNGQGLAAALRASANATGLGVGTDSKTQKRPILHARSAVGYNPVFGGSRFSAL